MLMDYYGLIMLVSEYITAFLILSTIIICMMIERGSAKYSFLLLEQRLQLAKATIEHMINMGVCIRQRGYQLCQCILIIERRYNLEFFYLNKSNNQAMEEVWAQVGELEEIFYLLIMDSKMIEVDILKKYVKNQTQWAVSVEAFNKEISKIPYFQIYSNPFVTVKIVRRLFRCQQIFVAFKPYVCTAIIGIGLLSDSHFIQASTVDKFPQPQEMKKSLIQQLTDLSVNSSQDAGVDKPKQKQEIKPKDKKEVAQSQGPHQKLQQATVDLSGEESTLHKSKLIKNQTNDNTQEREVRSTTITWLPAEDFIAFFIENFVHNKRSKVGIFTILKRYFDNKPSSNDAIKVFNNKANVQMIVQALKDNGIESQGSMIKQWGSCYKRPRPKKEK